jgi:hypothetical protein
MGGVRVFAFLLCAGRGVSAAIRARPGPFLLIGGGVLALDLFLPVVVLSLVRKPWTFFTFNPWLKKVPEYLASDVPLGRKLDFLSGVALFWFSADGPFGVPEWGFAVDTMDVVRFLAMALLIATYFVLWLARRERGLLAGPPGRGARAGGLLGTFVSVLGLSTGPCSVVGCGAPVLPVVGLVFAGLSSGTLALLSTFSRIVVPVVLTGLTAGVVYLGWRVGSTLPGGDGTTTRSRSPSRWTVSDRG